MLAAWQHGREHQETMAGGPLRFTGNEMLAGRWWLTDGCGDARLRSLDRAGEYQQARFGNGVLLVRRDAIQRADENDGYCAMSQDALDIMSSRNKTIVSRIKDLYRLPGVIVDWFDYNRITSSLMPSWNDYVSSVAVNDTGEVALVEYCESDLGADKHGVTVVSDSLAKTTDDIMRGKIREVRGIDHRYWPVLRDKQDKDKKRYTPSAKYDEWTAAPRRWWSRWFHSLPLWARVVLTAEVCYRDNSSYVAYGERIGQSWLSGPLPNVWTWLGELLRRLDAPESRRKLASMTREYGPIWFKMALNSMNNYVPRADDEEYSYDLNGGHASVRAITAALDSLCGSPKNKAGDGWSAPTDDSLVCDALEMAGAYGAPAACWPVFYLIRQVASMAPGSFKTLGEEETTLLLLSTDPCTWLAMLRDLLDAGRGRMSSERSMLTLTALASEYRFKPVTGPASDLVQTLAVGEEAIDHSKRLQSQLVDAQLAMEDALAELDGERTRRFATETGADLQALENNGGMKSGERRVIEDAARCYLDAAHKLPSDILLNHLSVLASEL